MCPDEVVSEIDELWSDYELDKGSNFDTSLKRLEEYFGDSTKKIHEYILEICPDMRLDEVIYITYDW